MCSTHFEGLLSCNLSKLLLNYDLKNDFLSDYDLCVWCLRLGSAEPAARPSAVATGQWGLEKVYIYTKQDTI